MSSVTHYKTAPEDRISLKQKAAYSVGMLVNNLQAAALPAMVVILNLGLGMDALWVGLIGALPRIFDAISDPMLGYISDNTRTRWGRRRPFICVGAITAGIIFALMWQLPSGYIDILSKTPVKQHQTLLPNERETEFNDAGGVVINYDAVTQPNVKLIFFGPELLELNKGSLATNLEGFPQIEINVDIPEVESFQVVIDESETDSDGESYYIDLAMADSEDDKGNLYKFKLADLQRSTIAGNQKGNSQLDMLAIQSISISLSGFEGTGIATIHALKLKKSEEFFVFYFATSW